MVADRALGSPVGSLKLQGPLCCQLLDRLVATLWVFEVVVEAWKVAERTPSLLMCNQAGLQRQHSPSGESFFFFLTCSLLDSLSKVHK